MNATVSHQMPHSAHLLRGREKKQKKQGHILRSTVYLLRTGTATSLVLQVGRRHRVTVRLLPK